MAASSGDDGVSSKLYADLQGRMELTKQKIQRFIEETSGIPGFPEQAAEYAKTAFEELSRRFQDFLTQFFPSGVQNLDPSLLEKFRQGIEDFAQERDCMDRRVSRDLFFLMLIQVLTEGKQGKFTESLQSKERQASSSVTGRPILAAEATASPPKDPYKGFPAFAAAARDVRKKFELDDEDDDDNEDDDQMTLEQLLESCEPLVLEGPPDNRTSKIFAKFLDLKERLEGTKQRVQKMMEVSCHVRLTEDQKDTVENSKMEFEEFNKRVEDMNDFFPAGIQDSGPLLLKEFHRWLRYCWHEHNEISFIIAANLLELQILAVFMAGEQEQSTDLLESKELQASSSVAGNLGAHDLLQPEVKAMEEIDGKRSQKQLEQLQEPESSPLRNRHPKLSPATMAEITGSPPKHGDGELTAEQLPESGEPLVQDTVPRQVSPKQQLQLDPAVAGWESMHKEHRAESEQAFQQAPEGLLHEVGVPEEREQAIAVQTVALPKPSTIWDCIAVILIIAIAILAWKLGAQAEAKWVRK